MAHPTNEERRLRELAATRLLDTPPDPSFERLTRLAARTLGVPVALVNLVEERREFFKSSYGLTEPWSSRRETPLSQSLFKHAVRDRLPLIVDDARNHEQLKATRAVQELGVVAYAGMPLLVNDQPIGTLCAIDYRARTWTAADLETLADLAAAVVSEIELRMALRALHERARLDDVLLESLGDSVLAIDRQGTFLVANAAARRLFEAGVEVGERVPSDWPSLHRSLRADGTPLAPEDGALARALRGEPTDGLELSLQRADASVATWVEAGGRPVRDDDGKVVAAIAVYRDLTARRAGSARLRESEALLSSVLESTPDAIVSVDRAGLLIAFNSRAAGDVRRAIAVELRLGRSLFEMLQGETRSFAIERHARCLAGEALRAEATLIDPDGQARHLLISHTPRVAGREVVGATIVAVDITKQKSVELEISAKNRAIELLRGIATTANEALVREDAIARVLELVATFGGWVAAHAFAVCDRVLISQETWYLRDRERLDRFRETTRELRFPAGVGLPGRALATKRIAWMTTLGDNPDFLRMDVAREAGLRSGVAFPILVRDEAPSAEIGDLLENVGRQVGRVVERDDHARELRNQSVTDELTGLYNRRGFLLLARQQLSTSAREGRPSALLAADLDGLKRINDQLGHAARDAAIAGFASVLRRTFRTADIVARLGGDEFVVWMANRADATRSSIARLTENLARENEGRPAAAQLAASIGTVEISPTSEGSLEALMARADELLYANKRARRDA